MISARNGSLESIGGGGAPPSRRGVGARAALLLGVAFTVGVVARVAAQDVLPDAEHLRWSGTLSQRTLDDGSVLSEYTARTAANDGIDASLAFRFVPRFGCSPLIGIRLDAALADGLEEALPEDGEELPLEIDGEAATVSLVADVDAAGTIYWLDEERAERERFRQRMDVGSRVELAPADGAPVIFSLLGSQRSVAAVEAACRSHVPPPYEE